MAMKKLTAAQAIAFLKTVGLDAELVEDAKDSDMTAKPEDATFVPTTMDDLIKLVDVNREPIISLKVKQELNESTHKDVTAKVYGGLRKQLISKGVPAADLEGKNEKEMADIAVAHFSKNKDADTEAINLQMQELIKNHESALQQTETKWKDKYTTLESTLTRKSILDNLKGIYKDAKGINPSANVDILAEDFLNDLERRANVKIGADGKTIELYDKTTNARMLNASSTTFASVNDQLKTFHEPRGQWNEDNRNIRAADVMKDKLNLDTTVNKDGRIESGPSKQIASVEAWANADSTAA